MDAQRANKTSFVGGGLGIVVVVLLAALVLYVVNRHKSSNSFTYALPELNEQGTKQWSDADKYLPCQTFTLNASQDTVIQTSGGLVIAVPANCFLGDDGKPVSGPVQLEVKEALDAASMMKAGLSTKSGNKLLESAGMFYLNGRKDGKSLKINPDNGIYVRVPADSIKSGMQAFEGKRMPDGTIDWINPKPLVHDLVPVNIHTINFYPPLYLDSLALWGKDIKNKKYTDSLYYSFASLFGARYPADTINYADTNSSVCGINPAKIKVIWNDEFQNTLISTREFEERMPFIHKTGNNDILDLYVNNLNKNLSSIDSLAAQELGGDLKAAFLSFAARGDGKVVVKSSLFQKLKAFFEKKSKLFTEAAVRAENEFLERKNRLDVDIVNKENAKEDRDEKREAKMMGDEYKQNLKEACRQVGDPDSVGITDRDGYAVLCTGTGWTNIDAYVEQSTLSRTTLNYTSPANGKTATIKYLPFSITVDNYQAYDNVFVYLLPDKLNSFMRLNDSNGKFKENLDELFSYRMKCIAYKGNQAYYYSINTVAPKDYSQFNLLPVSRDELSAKLEELGDKSQRNDMAKEVEYMQFENEDKMKQKQNEDVTNFRNKLEKVIFPCWRKER